MYTLSSAADHSLLWFGIGGLRALRRGDLKFAAKFGITMGVESGLTNGLIKSAFRRVRPEPEIAEGPLPYGMRRPITSSFPSGHATAAFTAASVLAAPGHGDAFWFTIATVVAGSRVYVRMHHASDVIAGALVGIALGRGRPALVRPPGEMTREVGVSIGYRPPERRFPCLERSSRRSTTAARSPATVTKR